MRGQAKGFPGDLGRDAVHLIHNSTGLDDGYPIFRIALALTHTCLSGLLGNRLIRKYPGPHLTAPFDIASDGDARSLDLPARDPVGLQGFQAELAERDLSAAI